MHLLAGSWIALVLSAAWGATALPYDSAIHVSLQRSRSLTNKRGVVQPHLLTAEVARLKGKYSRTLANFEQNVGTKHPLDVTHHPIGRRATANISLSDQQQNALWTGTISFGTPQQNIPIDFDTGSSDTLVNPSAYTPSKSSTQKKTGTTFKDTYGDGTSAEGQVYSDKLSIGGVSASKAYIGRSQQAFIQNEGNSQGISGMAFPRLASFRQKEPFFQSLIKAGALDEHAFMFKLREHGSVLTLGQSDPGATWVPVTNASYWSVDAQINDQKVTGIVDSGTSLIVAPPGTAKSLFESLGLQYTSEGGTLMATYNCNAPPTVHVTLGAKRVSLAGALSAGQTITGQCQLSIVGEDIGIDNSVILGDPLFQATTISFDVARERVGFA